MTSQQSDTSSHRFSTWWLAAFGALAVALLLAAMVWVVEAQVQQAEVLRAQWKGAPSAVQVTRIEGAQGKNTASGAATARPAGANGLMSASFDRP